MQIKQAIEQQFPGESILLLLKVMQSVERVEPIGMR